MSHFSIQLVALLSLTLLLPNTHGWGDDGHVIVCKIAQARLSITAAEAVQKLLLKSAEKELSSKCSWADHVHHIYPWSSALHYANTPDAVCSYNNSRDCIDYKKGIKGRCVVAAINNYTTQLLEYGSETKSKYNLTQALFFLSHFVGDIHQPLHCGFLSDSGGNSINVKWYTRKQNLHHVWDQTILQTEVDKFYDSDMGEFVDAIQQNITKVWANEVEEWEHCGDNDLPCPAQYASESSIDACKWAYKDATEGSVLSDDYFLSRSQIVNLRLAQAGVRLAAILNRVLDTKLSSSM
ncbi:endonuclease 2-like [Vigna umbellata]|uniref:endonuclease 2-like n=1 Tax=Vigna umbellata TaxID=87088 RepID=UPI001F5E7023|nr:endonuclease 2-like [Vigna umbellata]